jgi:hypothetical protein
MRYIGLALYAEGPTDYRFLQPLLQRLCNQLCAAEALVPVDFSEVAPLDHPVAAKDRSRLVRITEAARSHHGAWQILFVHGDGGGDPQAARAALVDPAISALRLASDGDECGVAVVPVRETESWALQDGDALRSVFGVTLTDAALGLPASAKAIEATIDPKAVLEAAFLATQPSGRRRKTGVAPMFNALGEQVSLDQLLKLPSFQALVADLRAALRELKVIR